MRARLSHRLKRAWRRALFAIATYTAFLRLVISTVATASALTVIQIFAGETYTVVFLVICVFLLLIWLQYIPTRIETDYFNSASVLAGFSKDVHVVIGMIRRPGDDSGPATTDLDTAALVSQLFGEIGREPKNPIFVYSDEADLDWDRDLIVIGGPAFNPYARHLCQAHRLPNCFIFTREDPGEHGNTFSISHTSLEKIIITDREVGGKSIDYGIVYIGPNPEQTDKRILWVAGLRPASTLAAARIVSTKEYLQKIAKQITREKSYCSFLFRYEYRKNLGHIGYAKGNFTGLCYSSGERAIPDVALEVDLEYDQRDTAQLSNQNFKE